MYEYDDLESVCYSDDILSDDFECFEYSVYLVDHYFVDQVTGVMLDFSLMMTNEYYEERVAEFSVECLDEYEALLIELNGEEDVETDSTDDSTDTTEETSTEEEAAEDSVLLELTSTTFGSNTFGSIAISSPVK
jgi:hypothetical protein